MYFYFSRASALRNSAAEIRPSYNKGQQEALDEFVGNFFTMDFAIPEWLYRVRRVILRLNQ